MGNENHFFYLSFRAIQYLGFFLYFTDCFFSFFSFLLITWFFQGWSVSRLSPQISSVLMALKSLRILFSFMASNNSNDLQTCDFSPCLSPEPQTHKFNCLPHISTYISNGIFDLTCPKQNTCFPAHQNLLRQW